MRVEKSFDIHTSYDNLKQNRLSIFTTNLDLPAIGFCYSLGNGQPDSAAASLSGAGIVRAVEAVKQAVQIFGVVQYTGIKNFDFRLSMGFIYIQTDGSIFIGIFHGIVQKDGNHLPCHVGIST